MHALKIIGQLEKEATVAYMHVWSYMQWLMKLCRLVYVGQSYIIHACMWNIITLESSSYTCIVSLQLHNNKQLRENIDDYSYIRYRKEAKRNICQCVPFSYR